MRTRALYSGSGSPLGERESIPRDVVAHLAKDLWNKTFVDMNSRRMQAYSHQVAEPHKTYQCIQVYACTFKASIHFGGFLQVVSALSGSYRSCQRPIGNRSQMSQTEIESGDDWVVVHVPGGGNTPVMMQILFSSIRVSMELFINQCVQP